MQTVRSNSSSGYKGVSWHVAKKWRAQVRIGGTNKNLGYFHTAEEAAKVYDAAALLYFGEFACTNFPREDYLCMLPVTGDWKVDADAGDGWRGQWSDRALKQIDGVLSVIAAELGINVDELHTSTGAGRKPGARGYIVYALHQLSQGNVEGAKNTLENALSGAA
jgi:hypothetical protein